MATIKFVEHANGVLEEIPSSNIIKILKADYWLNEVDPAGQYILYPVYWVEGKEVYRLKDDEDPYEFSEVNGEEIPLVLREYEKTLRIRLANQIKRNLDRLV